MHCSPRRRGAASGDGTTFLYAPEEPVVATLSRLTGVAVVPTTSPATGTGGNQTSAERLRDVAGEALIILEHPAATLDTNPFYPLLPAPQAGRVHNAGSYRTYAGTEGLRVLHDQLVGSARFLGGVAATPTR